MYPILIIAIGIVVLAFGKRLSVLGGAVGALLGVGLLRLFDGSSSLFLSLLIPLLLGAVGFFAAGFAKGIVSLVLLVLGTLAGAAIMMGFLDLFQFSTSLLYWLIVVLGGVIGLVLVRRFSEWAMIILAGLVGGMLVTRGLAVWLPFLQGAIGSLLVLVLAGAGIAYQGGLSSMGKTK